MFLRGHEITEFKYELILGLKNFEIHAHFFSKINISCNACEDSYMELTSHQNVVAFSIANVSFSSSFLFW